jgi:hypothetical protein
MTAHNLVTAALVYLSLGSLVWVALYSAGMIQETYRKRSKPKIAITLASIGVVCGWPVVGFVFFAGIFSGLAERARR